MSIKTASELLTAKLTEHCEVLREALAYVEDCLKDPSATFNPDHPTLLALSDMRRAQRVYGMAKASVLVEGADALVA